jgi:hypothetical protein
MAFNEHIDYGGVVPGVANAIATGSTQTTAALLFYRVNIFTSVPVGSGCMLPSASASRCMLTIINRSANDLLVYPAVGSQIEGLGINTPYTLGAGASIDFHCQDPEMSPGRQWYAAYAQGQVSSVNGKTGAVVLTYDDITGGSIQGTPIGSVTPAAGFFTTLNATSTTTLGGVLNLGSGSGNVNLFQGTTGLVWQMRLGAPSSQLRIQDSSANSLMTIDSTSINTIKTLRLQPSTTWNDAAPPRGIFENNIVTGSSNGAAYNLLQVADRLAVPGLDGATVFSVNMIMDAGSTASTGVRNTMKTSFTMNAPTGNVGVSGEQYTSFQSNVFVDSNDNGTPGNYKGSVFSGNFVTRCTGNATWFHQMTGPEIDICVQAGASVRHRLGLSIIRTDGDEVQGSSSDNAFVIGASEPQGSGKGWLCGISFGNAQGLFPMDPDNGTLLGAAVSSGTLLTKHGIDWSAITFSGNTWNDGKVKITAAGELITPLKTPASAAATGAQGQIAWDADYIYIATAANTWKRVAITTW